MARGPCAVGLQLNFGGSRGAPLAVPRLPRQPARPVLLEPPHDARAASLALPPDAPFMSDMDEISYWIHTKRAPCLMNCDNLLKKPSEEAQCSKVLNEEVHLPKKKKKKRKLSLLDGESASTVKKQNVYFEVPQRHNRPIIDICKSDSIGSDVDFNIRNATIAQKPKRAKMQKNTRPKLHKKSKAPVTSTPKANVHLRRSQRQTRQSDNNAHLDSSFEIFNNVTTNGHVKNCVISDQKLLSGNQTVEDKKNSSQKNKSKNTTHLNGQYEDLSDVSGFTANYIRSTKVQSSKTPRKIRCKSSRNLVKQSQQSPKGSNMIVCVNKSVNTSVPKADVVNCSSDSSQNIINFVTSKHNDKLLKVDKSTSLLKFVDRKSKKKECSLNKVDKKQKRKNNLNVSFQSQSSGTSRYPKRYRDETPVKTDNQACIGLNDSDKKENPDETVISRTRSGRNVSQTTHQRDNSVLVVSNSTEQVSSMVSMNVASTALAQQKTKRHITRQLRARKSLNKTGQSLRDKSGFAACFSESDDDSVPLVQKKYFCN